MQHAQRWGWFFVLLLAVVMPGAAQAKSKEKAGQKPVSMSEVSRLIKDGSTPQAVIKLMAERGVSFKMSGLADRRMKRLGFTEDQILLVHKIAKGEKVNLEPGAKGKGEAEDDAEGKDGPGGVEDEGAGDKAGEKKKKYTVGCPRSDAQHAAEKNRIVRAMKNAGLGYKRIELSRVTLYCHARRAKALATMLAGLEKQLIKTFPASLTNAITPASAHIVIVDGRSEWEAWINALFSSYMQDGIRHRFGPDDEDPRKTFVKFASFFLHNVVVVHADRQDGAERISRLAAYGLGDLMMGEAAGTDSPHGLSTGFGDFTEALVHKTPSVMLFSYQQRDLKQEKSWRNDVLTRFKAGGIKSTHSVWNYKTDTMKPEDYAECWSLVSTLAQAPEKFAEVVRLVREKKMKVKDAIVQVYKINDRQLLEAWFRYVGGRG